jgi:hypothetical protein
MLTNGKTGIIWIGNCARHSRQHRNETPFQIRGTFRLPDFFRKYRELSGSHSDLLWFSLLIAALGSKLAQEKFQFRSLDPVAVFRGGRVAGKPTSEGQADTFIRLAQASPEALAVFVANAQAS